MATTKNDITVNALEQAGRNTNEVADRVTAFDSDLAGETHALGDSYQQAAVDLRYGGSADTLGEGSSSGMSNS